MSTALLLCSCALASAANIDVNLGVSPFVNGTANKSSSNGTLTQVSSTWAGNTSGIITYQITGVDLTSEGGTASETIDFTVNLASGTAGTLSNQFNLVSVGGGALEVGEIVTFSVGSISSSTFGGDLSFVGFVGLQTDSLNAGDPDESANLTTIAGTVGLTPTSGPRSGKYMNVAMDPTSFFTIEGTSGAFFISGFDLQLAAVPEPSSAALLLGLSISGIVFVRRRR